MARYARPDLLPLITVYTPAEAAGMLRELDSRIGVIPSGGNTRVDIETLLEHAADLKLNTMELLIKHNTKLIAAASGVLKDQLNQFLPSSQAELVHRYRNVALCLALACTSEQHGDASQIASKFHAPKPRTASRNQARPYTDDEIALLNLWAWHMSHGDANGHRAAAVYALSASGMTPGETTKVRSDDVVLEPGLAMVEAPGLDSGVYPRIIELGSYATAVLTRYVDQANLTDGELLTYRPRKVHWESFREANAAAAASAQAILDRFRKSVRLNQLDTTAASIWMGRAASVLATEGAAAACALTGRTNVANLQEILWHGKPISTTARKRPRKKSFTI